MIHSGCDIGGFWGNEPSPELLLRWIQNGVFAPRFCIHSYKDDPTEVLQLKDSKDENIKDISIWPLAKELYDLRDQLFHIFIRLIMWLQQNLFRFKDHLFMIFQDDENVLEKSFNTFLDSP